MSKKQQRPSSFVQEKLKKLLADIKRVEQILKKESYEHVVSDPMTSVIAERLLERSINRAIDINLFLIRSQDAEPPGDYRKSFLMLGTLKILPEKLAFDLAPAVGTRNILVHEYDDLDSKLFYLALKNAVALFPKYAAAIIKWSE